MLQWHGHGEKPVSIRSQLLVGRRQALLVCSVCFFVTTVDRMRALTYCTAFQVSVL